MFSLLQVRPYEYRNPWDVPLADRVRMFYAKSKRAIYIYEGRDNSTFRYRVFNMVECVNATTECDISATWFYKDELEDVTRLIPYCDTLVICRVRHSPRLVQLVILARLHSVRVMFDVDDLIFDTQKLPILIDTIGEYREDESLNYWYAYVARQAEMLRLCEGAIVTNQYLADRLREAFPDKAVAIIPNFLNQIQQIYSEEIFRIKEQSGFASINPISIGYFSGSPSHRRDFDLAAPAIAEIFRRNTRMRLVLVGYIQPGEHLEKFYDRIDYYPMQDHVNLQRLIGSVDVNVVPLQNNEFTNCKSELKYFEAAIVGTVTVAAPTYTYARAISDEKTGYLANAGQWVEKIDGALAAVNSSRYTELAHVAFEEVKQKYGWNVHGKKILDVLSEK